MDLKQKYREETNKEPYGNVEDKDNFTLAYVSWLEEQLMLGAVVGRSEQLVCKGRCDHGYRDEFGNELFCSTKEKTAN